MDKVTSFLPIIIYILLIILIVVLIIIGIKVIKIMNKVDKVVDNVEEKINSLNGIFSIVTTTSNKITMIYDKLIDYTSWVIDKLLLKHKKRKDEDYE